MPGRWSSVLINSNPLFSGIFSGNFILLLRFAITHYAVAKAEAIFIAALPMPFDCCFLNYAVAGAFSMHVFCRCCQYYCWLLCIVFYLLIPDWLSQLLSLHCTTVLAAVLLHWLIVAILLSITSPVFVCHRGCSFVHNSCCSCQQHFPAMPLCIVTHLLFLSVC